MTAPEGMYIFMMKENGNGDLPYFIRKYHILPKSGSPAVSPPLHAHEATQINFVISGSARHFIRDNDYTIARGDIFVIPPMVPHQLYALDDGENEIIEFEFMPEFISTSLDSLSMAKSFLDFAYIEPMLVEENLVKSRLNLSGNALTMVEKLLEEMLAEDRTRSTGFDLVIKSNLLKLLVLVGREYSLSPVSVSTNKLVNRYHSTIHGAMDYIEMNYTQDLTLESVAARFGLSASFFSYVFKNVASKRFSDYIRDLRIARACQLLSSTDDKVIEICYQSGFNNLNHFNRVFKQLMLVSPTAYRNRARKDAGIQKKD